MNRTRRTLTTLSLTALGTAALAGATPQDPAPSKQTSALETVRAIFQRLDRDGSKTVTASEALAAKVNQELFDRHDADGSKGLDAEEFTVLYRELLTKAKREVPKEVQTEVARIQSRRRAREEEAKRKEEQAKEAKDGAEAGEPADAPPANGPAPAGPAAKPAPGQPAPAKPAPAKPAPANPAPAQPAPGSPASGTPTPVTPAPGGPIQPGSKPSVGTRPQPAPAKPQPAPVKPAPAKPQPAPETPQPAPAPGAGAQDDLTPEARRQLEERIQAARAQWMLQWRKAQLEKDAAAADSYGAALPEDLRADLLARVEAAWTGSLREWMAANPDKDITNLDPTTRGALAKLADQARDEARNAWAAEKRALLVERAKRAKEQAQGDSKDPGAGKPADAPESKEKPVADPGAKPAPKPQGETPKPGAGSKGESGATPAKEPKRVKRTVRPANLPPKKDADPGKGKG